MTGIGEGCVCSDFLSVEVVGGVVVILVVWLLICFMGYVDGKYSVGV